jgi:transcriptional regulator with XRE-family HTH domain
LSMTNIRDILAKNMRAYRNALGFTQAQLAEKVSTSTHYIGMIEAKKKFPSPEMLERIAFAMEIDTIDLFSTEINLPETMKTYRKAALKNIKNLLMNVLDDEITNLDKVSAAKTSDSKPILTM